MKNLMNSNTVEISENEKIEISGGVIGIDDVALGLALVFVAFMFSEGVNDARN